ncbi:MAG: cyclic nucleotide-binding domain-containing protein [Deltaproteobacteria bacterium]|nr:cyclic nucleotide-binding domain-containing protein [Deltaproteobacteria bacterium]
MADIRKLKDSVAEYLRKQKYDKAAETLEELVRAEPKDMQHRLKLGDAYRRLGIEEKAISSYRIAAKLFGDEGQLIKAIGAIKVILEIDPKNEMAQRELADLNNRRFGKPTLEAAGLKVAKGIGAGARAVSSLELEEGQKAADDIASLFEAGKQQLEPGPDDEALELDTGDHSKPAPPSKGVAPVFTPPKQAQRGVVAARGEPERRGPPPVQRPKIDLDGRDELIDGPIEAELEPLEEVMELEEVKGEGLPKPQPKVPSKPAPAPAARPKQTAPVEEVMIDLDPVAEVEPEEITELEALPDDAIEPPKPKAAAAAPTEVVLDLEPSAPPPARVPPRPAPAPPPPVVAAAPPTLEPVEEILDLDAELVSEEPAAPPVQVRPYVPPPPPPKPTGPPQPIADLLGGGAEEEIELLSISTDQELVPPPAPAHSTPPISATGEDLDAAFGAISPAAAPPPPKKVPPKVPLFDDLSQEAFVELVNQVNYRRFTAGEVVITEGEPGRSFFVIVEGKVRVYKKLADGQELQLAELGEGAFFGEMALLSGANRTAHVAALDDTELLEVTDTVLRDIVAKYPAVASSLKNFYRQRLLNNVMAISQLFKDFDPAERKSIVERFRMKQGTPDEVFITEGKQSDGLYVVLHGSVRVTKKGENDQDIELAKLKEGELFGEMSLLTRAPASATVKSNGPTIVLKLPRENWQELMLTHPQILELVSDLTEKRRSATEAILSGMGAGHDGMSFV